MIKKKQQLAYRTNIINPKFEPPSYTHKITNLKKKLVITKLRTNSHEQHSKIGRWIILKTPWDNFFCNFYIVNAIEGKTHFPFFCSLQRH